MILRLRHTVSNERRHRQPAAGNACCSKGGSGILIPDPLCCLSKPVRQSWTGFGKQRLPLRFAAVFLRLSKNKVFRTVSRLKLQFQTKFRYKRVRKPHPFDRFVSQNRARPRPLSLGLQPIHLEARFCDAAHRAAIQNALRREIFLCDVHSVVWGCGCKGEARDEGHTARGRGGAAIPARRTNVFRKKAQNL